MITTTIYMYITCVVNVNKTYICATNDDLFLNDGLTYDEGTGGVLSE